MATRNDPAMLRHRVHTVSLGCSITLLAHARFKSRGKDHYIEWLHFVGLSKSATIIVLSHSHQHLAVSLRRFQEHCCYW